MNKIKRLIINKYFLLIGIVFLLTVGLSYAYFTSILDTDGEANNIVTETGTLKLNYVGGPQVSMLKAYPGDYITKEIVIENTGTLEANYNIYMDEIQNNITGNELVISGTCTRYLNDVENGTCNNILIQPLTVSGVQTLKGNISLERNVKHIYNLTILFKEMDKNQNYNQGKSFSGRIQVNEYKYDPNETAVINNAEIVDLKLTATITDGDGIIGYCVTDASENSCGTWVELDESTTSLTLTDINVDDYDKKLWIKNNIGNITYEDLTPNPQLTVNPDNGEWEESTQAQTFNMEYKETKNISDPTKRGFNFLNWVVSGEESTLVNKEFTMGIENSSLVASWNPIEYTATINPNGGEYNSTTSNSLVSADYKTNVEITSPTRSGHTFTGWTLSNNEDCVLNTTTLTMGFEGCTLTAGWEINDYPYITYHNKQNVNGVGYTLVSADTEEGEATYGTQVTPSTKTYTGFTSPSAQTITIVEDITPPVHNLINYNYARNKYDLIVNPNGGNYNGSTSNVTLSNLYYESETTLQSISRVGYNFTSWTVSGTNSNVTNNVFKMGTVNSTITAGWEAMTMTVNYNVNGGNNVSPSSKTVTYGNTYGTLPTPTRTNYKFLGWYTASTGGTKVESTTNVTSTTNHTIYAHWQQKVALLQNINSTHVTYADNVASAFVTSSTGIDFSSQTSSTNGHGLYTNNKYGTGNVKYFRGGTYCEGYTTSSGVCNKAGYNYNQATCSVDSSKTECEAAGGVFRDIANDVIFAGKHWKILSIQGNNVRLIYNGTGDTSVYNYAFSSTGNYSDTKDLQNIGYMYGTYNNPDDEEFEFTDSPWNLNMANTTSNDIKNDLDDFYDNNLASYSSYLTDTGYCNERSGIASMYWQWQEKYVEFKTNAIERLETNFAPTFNCSTNDLFTLTSSTTGNKSLTRPIGIISADEAIYAGIIYDVDYTSEVTNSFLNVSGQYWTMTPKSSLAIDGYYNSGPMMYAIHGGRLLMGTLETSSYFGIRPVISISGSSLSTGSGTRIDPYVIE